MPYIPHLDPAGPRHLAIADAIVADIRSGRLAPQDPLPGIRTLAQLLSLNRNTVLRGYRELAAQGWVISRPGSGTRVAPNLPLSPAPPQTTSPHTGFFLPPSTLPVHPRTPAAPYPFMAGQPDLRLLPLTQLARAYRRALRGRGRILVDYGDPQGSLALRTALSSWLSAQRSLLAPAERILVTRGAQQALYLAAHCLFRPGDRVAVEAYGYQPAWEALRSAGVELVPVPIDAHGLIVDKLAQIPGLRGVYLTPHHQYPTGAMLSADRREALLRFARQRRIPILEDDYDHEFHWDGHPVAPLAARDPHGLVVYLGTLSKAFAPGLRIGWVSAPPNAIERMTALRRLIDRQGDQVVEHAVAELLREGELQRHIRRVHRCYRARRAALIDSLSTQLPDLEPHIPPGGLGLWCLAPGIDVEAWRREALDQGVEFQSMSRFNPDPDAPPSVRFGFPRLDPDEIREGTRRLALALARTRDRFDIQPTWSVSLPGSSCNAIRIRTPDGDRVQKTYPSTRSFDQARRALNRVDPQRILGASSPHLLLRWIPGEAGSLEPRAHHAAGRWLREYQSPAPGDLPLVEAFSKRIERTRHELAPFGLQLDLDPKLFDSDRVHCHRDFRPDNWVWSESELQIIDFEHARPDHPLVDLVKLATEVWPGHPHLERAFLDAYGPIDRAVLDGLITLHGANTLLWAERHGDEALSTLGRRILARA